MWLTKIITLQTSLWAFFAPKSFQIFAAISTHQIHLIWFTIRSCTYIVFVFFSVHCTAFCFFVFLKRFCCSIKHIYIAITIIYRHCADTLIYIYIFICFFVKYCYMHSYVCIPSGHVWSVFTTVWGPLRIWAGGGSPWHVTHVSQDHSHKSALDSMNACSSRGDGGKGEFDGLK